MHVMAWIMSLNCGECHKLAAHYETGERIVESCYSKSAPSFFPGLEGSKTFQRKKYD